ncbi:MAG: hypothetical protein JNG84_14350 [Archangium sp.]|nr:hypothetical protein [Archangium sp.]
MRRALLVMAALLPASTWAAAVLVVSGDDASRNLKDDIAEVLAASQLVVKSAGPKAPATACLTGGDAACFANAAQAAKIDALLVVKTVEKKGALTVTFELLAGATGALAKKETVKTPKARFKAASTPVLKRLAAVVGTLPKRPEPVAKPAEPEPKPEPKPVEPVAVAPKPVSDRPVETPLTPRPADPQQPVIIGTDDSKSVPVAAVITTVVAVGAATTAGIFAGMGFNTRARLERAPDGVSPFTYSQAQTLQRDANTQLSIALGAAIGAGVTGALAGFLWSRE